MLQTNKMTKLRNKSIILENISIILVFLCVIFSIFTVFYPIGCVNNYGNNYCIQKYLKYIGSASNSSVVFKKCVNNNDTIYTCYTQYVTYSKTIGNITFSCSFIKFDDIDFYPINISNNETGIFYVNRDGECDNVDESDNTFIYTGLIFVVLAHIGLIINVILNFYTGKYVIAKMLLCSFTIQLIVITTVLFLTKEAVGVSCVIIMMTLYSSFAMIVLLENEETEVSPL